MRPVLQPLLTALFRLLFTYECEGEELLPDGAGVVAANHPSYLDPILLSLEVARPIHFMAWDALFRVPLLGALMRSFGAFPVDVRPGQGREAYERAKALVLAGNLVGIFPEGKRSRAGWMEELLREGAARLAWETGAPLVPATITGAFRAWPHFQALPRPARIRVRFHAAIDPAPYRRQPEEEALPALLAELRVAGRAEPAARGEGRPAQDRPAPPARALAVPLRGAAGGRRGDARVLEDAGVRRRCCPRTSSSRTCSSTASCPALLARQVPARGGAGGCSRWRSCRWCWRRSGCPSRLRTWLSPRSWPAASSRTSTNATRPRRARVRASCWRSAVECVALA